MRHGDTHLSNEFLRMDVPRIKALLQSGAVPGQSTRISLPISYFKGKDQTYIECRSEVLELLLAHGLDPCIPDALTKQTLLHIVCANIAPVGDIRLILSAGGRGAINARDIDDNTPLLSYAGRRLEPQQFPPEESGIDLLVSYGADVNAIDGGGRTAEQTLRDGRSFQWHQLADYLVARNFALNGGSPGGPTPGG